MHVYASIFNFFLMSCEQQESWGLSSSLEGSVLSSRYVLGGRTVSSYISLEAKLFTHVEMFPWNYSLTSRLQLYSYLQDTHRIISMVEFSSYNINNN